MNQTINVNEEFDKYIKANEGQIRLLLHSCCAPCSSYCLFYTAQYLPVTVFYYNPNISESAEYDLRAREQIRLIDCFNKEGKCKYPIEYIISDHRPEDFAGKVAGYEDCPERGARCSICFDIRLRETARVAKEKGFDAFATTLTLSPLKNAGLLNETGLRIESEEGIKYLPTDFKKKNGYKTSIELSKEYNLYRQDFCGCIFSKIQREREKDNGKIS